MAAWISLYDLFTVGLALEVGGAALLVKAVLLSPARILKENALWGSPYYRVVAATQNRTESFVGFCGLAAGFIVQVAAYVAYVAHGGEAAFGWKRAIVAGGLAGAVAPAWFCVGTYVNHWLLRPLLIRVARERLNELPLAHPRADALVRWGKAAGFPAKPAETVPEYLVRVFKVNESVVPKTGGGWYPLDEAPPEAVPDLFED